MFPEDVETITMTKEDYDRNVEQLLVEKLELEHKYNLMKKNAYQLAMKIDKAIECINYYAIENEDYSKLYDVEEEELLKILKGESK